MRIKDEDEKAHKDTVENTQMHVYCLEAYHGKLVHHI